MMSKRLSVRPRMISIMMAKTMTTANRMRAMAAIIMMTMASHRTRGLSSVGVAGRGRPDSEVPLVCLF